MLLQNKVLITRYDELWVLGEISQVAEWPGIKPGYLHAILPRALGGLGVGAGQIDRAIR